MITDEMMESLGIAIADSHERNGRHHLITRHLQELERALKSMRGDKDADQQGA